MRCGDTGHRLASCSMPAAPPVRPRLDLLGHGVESIFYYIDLGGVPMTVPKNLAMVTVFPDQLPPVAEGLTVEILRDELAQIMPGHEWQAREISPSEFAVVFPSAEMLRLCTMGTNFTLTLNKIQVSITASSAVPATAPTLDSTWVRIHGIPDEARRSDCVELISQALGKLVEIDVRSLAGSGAVRLRVLAPEPAKLPGLLPPLYFGGCGGNRGAVLRVELDEAMPRSPTPPPTDGDPAGDDGASSEDDSSGNDVGGDRKSVV